MRMNILTRENKKIGVNLKKNIWIKNKKLFSKNAKEWKNKGNKKIGMKNKKC